MIKIVFIWDSMKEKSLSPVVTFVITVYAQGHRK